MPLQVERQLMIQAVLQEHQTVRVEELAARLQVSPNTIRRDLTLLEKQGVLKRTQGGAIRQEIQQHLARPPFDSRSLNNLAEKERIGKYAATLVKPGSTIILDAGTTTQQLANYLPTSAHVTVATNSLEAAYTLMLQPGITVILSGGILLGRTRSLIGLPAENFFAQIHAEQLFLAASGISLENGLTNGNMYETPVKQKMIAVAKEVILLADHEKFGKVSLSPFAPLRCVHKIITDADLPPAMLAQLTAAGIEVLLAK